ncbi:MAG: ribonuclease P protein component [Nitrospiraceae bacterium]
MRPAPKDGGLFIRRSRDIDRIKRNGRRVSTALFNLLISRSEGPSGRMAIIVGKRFGNAVSRNRAKRRFRELGRPLRDRFEEGQQFLVFPKREALVRPFHSVKEAWIKVLQGQGLVAKPSCDHCL